ncbi:MAG: NTP transferase domain-containing protein [Christensenellaceae bacterium]|nr:NTP transferase domain-containing protein [Christensenellaceae bacterium]
MPLSRYDFEVLAYLERKGRQEYSIRDISDDLCISGVAIMKCLDELRQTGRIDVFGPEYCITGKGLEVLEPYRVRRAVILAAGFGSRMMPATADRPKPMVSVNGVRIIDTLLDALVKNGITEITIVRGYKKEKLDELLIKYPFLRFIDNDDYAKTNNISSAVLALDEIREGCYICEADLYITEPAVITKYQYSSNILGSYSLETDDWSFRMKDGYISEYQKGNTYCYNYYGISYWTPDDCKKLRRDFPDVFSEDGGKDVFWELVPLVLRKDNYKVEIRQCRKQDIMEIDNYYELNQLDKSYTL